MPIPRVVEREKEQDVKMAMDNPNEVWLSQAEASLIAELRQAVHDLEQQTRGALLLIIRARGLQGNWALKSADRIVRAD